MANTNNQDPSGSYDAAGHLLSDGVHSYTYDAEGRISTVDNSTQYYYDAEGRRLAEGAVGQTPATDFLYDLSGNLVTTVGSDFKLLRTNLYVAGHHWADYTAGTGNGSGGGRTEFRLVDQVATLVYKFDQNGNGLEQCTEGPFGENLSCNNNVDFTEDHFTDKKRDQESNLDYFGARYYGSNMGRFMSPDPSALYFADPTNPQTLNLYSYGQNNPLTNVDPDGLDACAYDGGNGTATILNDANGGAVTCPGNGFYITTTQQVTAVGFNQNGDLSVYGANGNLYNPDGSAYDVTQSVSVSASGATGFDTTSQIVSTPIQYVATLPSGFNQSPVGQGVLGSLWHYGNWCGSGGQGPATNPTDAACIAHDACYFQGGFGAGSNFQRGQSGALQACNQALVGAVSARRAQLQSEQNLTDAQRKESRADWQIIRYFSNVPFGNSATSQ